MATEARFCDLPPELQTMILALAGAPILTCKAAAALLHESDAIQLWLAARHANPLAVAASYGLWPVWCALVEAGHRVTNADYAAALFNASQAGQQETVCRMLALPVSPPASTLQLATASAARRGSWGVMQALLTYASSRGVDVNRSQLVRILAQRGHIKLVRCLLHREGDPALEGILNGTAEQDWQAVLGLVQQQDRGLPASLLLQYAVDHLGSAGLQALLQCSAVRVSDDHEAGDNALLTAAQQGKARCLQLLLQHGVAPRFDGVVSAAVQGGYHRCVQLLLPQLPPHIWRRSALAVAAAHGYSRILQLLLDHIDSLPHEGSHLPAADLAIAFSNAACRGHLKCAGLLFDRIVQETYYGWHDMQIEVDRSLAAAARAGDWQMVDLITSCSWPDDAVRNTPPHGFTITHGLPLTTARAPPPGLWCDPSASYALNALLDPATAPEVDMHLRTLYPVQQRKPLGEGASGSCDSLNTDAGSGGTYDAGTSSAHVSDTSSNNGEPHTEVEQEGVDEVEVPSLQQCTPSRSKAAVLLLRAGAEVVLSHSSNLIELADREDNDELRELVRSYQPADQAPAPVADGAL